METWRGLLTDDPMETRMDVSMETGMVMYWALLLVPCWGLHSGSYSAGSKEIGME